jgi:hypothetical protein
MTFAFMVDVAINCNLLTASSVYSLLTEVDFLLSTHLAKIKLE